VLKKFIVSRIRLFILFERLPKLDNCIPFVPKLAKLSVKFVYFIYISRRS
jgi:hypothetical protein